MTELQPQNQTYNSEIIAHLSREIESITQAMTSFRGRFQFTVFFAPFVALGSWLYIQKDGFANINHECIVLTLLVFAVIFWGVLGFLAYSIEKHMWDQCNEWRACIAKLQNINSPPLDKEKFIFKNNLEMGYGTVYVCEFLMFLTIILALYLKS